MQTWISDIEACGIDHDWRGNLYRNLLTMESFAPELQDIVSALRNGVKLTLEQGIQLWNYPNLSVVANLADAPPPL